MTAAHELDGLIEEMLPAATEIAVCVRDRDAAGVHAALEPVLDAGDRDRRERTAARTRGEARRFRTAAAAAEVGDGEALSMFATVRYVVDEDETRRVLGDMTGADHMFVANGYRESAAKARMLEAFHRAVAKKVGRRKTSAVFTEAEYQRLYDSITGRGPESKAA